MSVPEPKTTLTFFCAKHFQHCVNYCPGCRDEHTEHFPNAPAAGGSAGSAEPNARGAGLKFDGDKSRWSLLMGGMPKALAGVAAVLTFGAKKYAAHSWKQVENNKERYRDALYRHLNQLEAGELVDSESGLSHWDHIACNALFLSELSKGHA